MNQVNLIGRLTKDPELRTTQYGQKTCTFHLAVDRPKDKNGNQQADFIRCVSWGATAENLVKYQSKGSQIGVTGRIQTGKYQNQQGQTVYTTDVYVQQLKYLDYKNSKAQAGYQQGNGQSYSGYQSQGYDQPQGGYGGYAYDDPNVPF